MLGRLALEGLRLDRLFLSATSDGGVQFEWELPQRYIEVEVTVTGTYEYLYEEESGSTEGDASLDEIIGLVRRLIDAG